MTDCDKIAGLLSAYYDGELNASEQELVRTHLDECGQCAALLRLFGDVTGAFDDIEAPAELRERVMNALPEARTRRAVNTKRIVLWRIIPAAACLAIVLIALPMLVNSGKSDSNTGAQVSGGAMTGGTAGDRSGGNATSPVETMMRAEVAEDEFDGEIAMMDDSDTETGAGEDGSAYDAAGKAAEPKTFGATNSGNTPPPEETPAPQLETAPSETGSVTGATRVWDFAAYYAVIKLAGEFPPELFEMIGKDCVVSYDAASGEQSVIVPRDVADALIADGYDYVLYNEDAGEAVVILTAADDEAAR